MSAEPLRRLIGAELASRGLADAYIGRGGGKPRRTSWDSIVPGFGTRHSATGRTVHIVQVEVDGRTVTMTIGNAAAIGRREARDIARRVKLRAQSGDDPAKERKAKRATPAFAKFLALYFERAAPSWKPSTWRTNQIYRGQHLDRAFADRPLDEITKADVQRWFVEVSDRSGPGAANRTHAILRAAFNKAEEWGLRREGSNPCTGIKLNRPRKFERFLSDAEIGRLGEALRAHEAQFPGPVAIIRLLLLTGCRYSEIAELTWSEVVRSRIRLDDSKTGARTVWMGDEAQDQLRAMPRGKPSDYVFVNPRTQRPFRSLTSYWHPIRAEAGLGKVRLHDLRHSFASHAAAASETLPMIGKLLGHAKVDSTARYAHLDDGQLLEVAEKIGVLIELAMA